VNPRCRCRWSCPLNRRAAVPTPRSQCLHQRNSFSDHANGSFYSKRAMRWPGFDVPFGAEKPSAEFCSNSDKFAGFHVDSDAQISRPNEVHGPRHCFDQRQVRLRVAQGMSPPSPDDSLATASSRSSGGSNSPGARHPSKWLNGFTSPKSWRACASLSTRWT
jgi:hypothetical protein